MSINLANPTTALEMVDAAANHVAQCRIAIAIGDHNKANKSLDEVSTLLFHATNKLENLNHSEHEN